MCCGILLLCCGARGNYSTSITVRASQHAAAVTVCLGVLLLSVSPCCAVHPCTKLVETTSTTIYRYLVRCTRHHALPNMLYCHRCATCVVFILNRYFYSMTSSINTPSVKSRIFPPRQIPRSYNNVVQDRHTNRYHEHNREWIEVGPAPRILSSSGSPRPNRAYRRSVYRGRVLCCVSWVTCCVVPFGLCCFKWQVAFKTAQPLPFVSPGVVAPGPLRSTNIRRCGGWWVV